MIAKKVISVGECMAELQLAQSELYSLKFGGDTFNTAWYIRAVTEPEALTVQFLTAVGSDQLSIEMCAFLKRNGIGTDLIRQSANRNLGLYLINLREGERSFTYWREASAARLLAVDEDRLRKDLAQADLVYFSGVTLAILAPDHRRTLLNTLQECKLRGAIVAFDSNIRSKLWPSEAELRKAITEGYKVATLALPTFEDEQAVFGDSDPAGCAHRIVGYGVAEVVVKDGPRPCTLKMGADLFTVAGEPARDVVDTTGAGDSFNAGYIAARLSDRHPRESAHFAHSVACRVIGYRGALIDMRVFHDLVLTAQ